MAATLDHDLEGLSLVEEEDGGFCIDVEKDDTQSFDLALCLVGRFLTDRPIRHVMKERMAGVWRPGRKVLVKEIDTGIFVFQFFHKLDIQRIFNGGPWYFDNHILLMERIQPGDIPNQIPLFHATFWVQIHDLPAGFMSLVVGKALGNYIREFMEYDSKNNSGLWTNYMRIRVRLDVRQPLKQSKKVKKPAGEWRTVRFKYERLGIFLFSVWSAWAHRTTL